MYKVKRVLLIMITNLRYVFSITILFFSFCAGAQNNYWQPVNTTKAPTNAALESLHKDTFLSYTLLYSSLLQELKNVPHREQLNTTPLPVVYFPDYDGNMLAFRLQETPVLPTALQEKYPAIRSFKGVSTDGNNHVVRFSTSQKGLQALILFSDGKVPAVIEKAHKDSSSIYVVFKRDAREGDKFRFECTTESTKGENTIQQSQKNGSTSKDNNDQLLRKYRIAISTTGEYTAYHYQSDSIADALAAIANTLTRINAIYERDLGITLELVANNDQIIYTDASTDPYNGNNSSELQNTLTTVIGEANYDVGHLFNRASNNGNAGCIGCVCVDGQKGRAFSEALVPEGDVFDIDLVAHEIGHQFGGRHTQTNSCARDTSGATNIEVGSGSTIMGYAGICPPDVQGNSDAYFDYANIQNITQYIQQGNGSTCAQEIVLSNNPPTVSAGPDYTIPIGTPFKLTAQATDIDGDVLTYTWEQIDTGFSGNQPPQSSNTSGPLFRSLPPSTNPTRYFPVIDDVLSGDLGNTWEVLPNVSRPLNFAVTVRDNVVGGGQNASDVVTLQAVSQAGPFRVTSQDSNVTYQGGSVQTITWDVAFTNIAPVDASQVNILLSVDGGQTFPIVLDQNVVNDGSHQVIIPGGISTTNARIMVEAADNVFYAVNSANFTITNAPFVMQLSELQISACQPNNLITNFTYNTFQGFSEEVTFSASNVPPGLSVTFNPTSASVNNTNVQITISGTSSVSPGSYPITITGTSASETKDIVLTATVLNDNFTDVVLLTPVNGDNAVFFNQVLNWQIHPNAETYEIELATDSNFTNIIASETVEINSYKPTALQPETTYYWRVKPINQCGEGSFGTPFSFTTLMVNCKTEIAPNTPIPISDQGPSVIQAPIFVGENALVSDVNVTLDISHEYISDLTIKLTSPSGTTVTLLSEVCNSNNDIVAVFDDEGSAIVCGDNPAISGVVIPLQPLSAFFGESSQGTWILEVADNFDQDGGSLNNFELELCLAGDTDSDNDGIFDSADNCDLVPNPDQADLDNDDIGDVCDDDIDGDGVLNDSDNCPTAFNPDQLDIDQDGEGDVCDEDVLVSQAFTPNGDGINDTWRLVNINLYPNAVVTVFNRWGRQIFKAYGYANNWNGVPKGKSKKVPPGSYYYQVDLEGDGKIDFKGWLYITY